MAPYECCIGCEPRPYGDAALVGLKGDTVMEPPTAIPDWLPENHKWNKLSTKEKGRYSRDAPPQPRLDAEQAEDSFPPIASLHALLGDTMIDGLPIGDSTPTVIHSN